MSASLVALASLSTAADATVAPVQQGYVLQDTETWELRNTEGEVYRIFVSKPNGPAPAGGYPVLYVLDGNAMFAGFAEARRIQADVAPTTSTPASIGNSIIVGIGYPTELPYDGTRRLYDFTPPYPAKIPPSEAALAKFRAGGQARFADFLLNRLRAEVAKRYTINPARQALYGHSLGGLLALHILYTHPTAFHAIIAASPSQWWNDQSILTEERAFSKRLAQGQFAEPVSRLLIVYGEREDRVVNTWDGEALGARLAPLSAYGLRSRFEMLDGEKHITVPHRSITMALRFALTWP